jgi:hypothetical protein
MHKKVGPFLRNYGNGLNDCVCDLSKRMPNYDGSHKQLQGT